jgi:hypothetical protein
MRTAEAAKEVAAVGTRSRLQEGCNYAVNSLYINANNRATEQHYISNPVHCAR